MPTILHKNNVATKITEKTAKEAPKVTDDVVEATDEVIEEVVSEPAVTAEVKKPAKAKGKK